MGEGKGCCYSGPEESCCNDKNKWFDFVPYSISAVLGGSGANLLLKDSAREDPATSRPLLSTAFKTSPTSAPASTTQAPGFDGHDVAGTSYNNRYPNSAIAVIAVLASFLATSLAAHVFIWYKRPRKNTAKLPPAQPLNETSMPISSAHYQGQYRTHIPGPSELDSIAINGRPSELSGI